MTRQRFATAAGVLLITALGFFVFPGHTFLESDTQIYLPILEHLWNPAVLAGDPMASRPHVTYTIYDETAMALRQITGLPFEPVLKGQQFVYRALGVWGVYMIASACGLAMAPAFLTAAIVSLGATINGPTVLTVEYEPVPRGFALPFVLLSMGLVARGQWRWAAAAAGAGFLFHPPTAAGYCYLIVGAAWYLNRRRDLLPLAGAAALLLFLVFVPERPPDGQQVFSRIDMGLERLQRLRANYNWVSVWFARWAAQYVLLALLAAVALWRTWRELPAALRVFFIGLPLMGLLSLPVSYLLLERTKWMLIPQFQPARYLLYVTLTAVLLSGIAGLRAAARGRVAEAAAFLAPCFIVPLQADLFAIQPRIWLAAVVLAAASVLAARWRAGAIAVAGIAAASFFVMYTVAPRAPRTSEDPQLNAIAEWARRSTPADSVFFFPYAGRSVAPGVFRARALRAVYVDWKSGGQVNFLKSFARIWWERWSSLTKPQPPEALAQRGIDYLIVPASRGEGAVYRNEGYAAVPVR